MGTGRASIVAIKQDTLIVFIFELTQHEAIPRCVWWSLCFLVFVVLWHLSARLCGGVGVFLC